MPMFFMIQDMRADIGSLSTQLHTEILWPQHGYCMQPVKEILWHFEFESAVTLWETVRPVGPPSFNDE